jgi:hypothetical protein
MGILIEKLNSVITKHIQHKKSNIFTRYKIFSFQQIPYFKSANLVDLQETKHGFNFTIELIPDVNKNSDYKVFYRKIYFSFYIEENTRDGTLRLFDINGITLYLSHFRTVELEDDTSPFLLTRNDIEKFIYHIISSVEESLLNKGKVSILTEYRRNTFLGYLGGLKEKYFTESNISLSNFIFDEEL